MEETRGIVMFLQGFLKNIVLISILSALTLWVVRGSYWGSVIFIVDIG